MLPAEVIPYLDRLREMGMSDRLVEGQRDGWILIAARWPEHIRKWMPAKLAELDDPQVVRRYQVLSELTASDAGDDDPRLEEAADIMAGLAEQACTAGDASFSEEADDDLPFDLLDALGNEYDHRVARLQELMRERGWARWTRRERLAGPPD